MNATGEGRIGLTRIRPNYSAFKGGMIRPISLASLPRNRKNAEHDRQFLRSNDGAQAEITGSSPGCDSAQTFQYPDRAGLHGLDFADSFWTTGNGTRASCVKPKWSIFLPIWLWDGKVFLNAESGTECAAFLYNEGLYPRFEQTGNRGEKSAELRLRSEVGGQRARGSLCDCRSSIRGVRFRKKEQRK